MTDYEDTRGCKECGNRMPPPTKAELREGEQPCLGCGALYDVDELDCARYIAELLDRIEVLEFIALKGYCGPGDALTNAQAGMKERDDWYKLKATGL